MALDLKQLLTEQLSWYWDAMLMPRLDHLSDDEHLWEPADGCWSVREADGRWVADRVTPTPTPPPVTTIAWRIAHLIEVLGCRASYHFGDRSFEPSEVLTGTAAGDLAVLKAAYERWAEGVRALDASGLERASEGPPNTLDSQFPFAAVILHINREVIHHGAELGVLRDLYRATLRSSPLVIAIRGGDRAAVDALLSDDPSLTERLRREYPGLLVDIIANGTRAGVTLALDLGFDVNAAVGHTALHHAAAAGDLELVKVLLDRGGDLTITDATYHATPLGWAEFFGQQEMASFLRPRSPGP